MNEETHSPFNVLPGSTNIFRKTGHVHGGTLLYKDVVCFIESSPQPKTIIEVGLKRLRSVAGLFVFVCLCVKGGVCVLGVMKTKNGKRKSVRNAQ